MYTGETKRASPLPGENSTYPIAFDAPFVRCVNTTSAVTHKFHTDIGIPEVNLYQPFTVYNATWEESKETTDSPLVLKWSLPIGWLPTSEDPEESDEEEDIYTVVFEQKTSACSLHSASCRRTYLSTVVTPASPTGSMEKGSAGISPKGQP